MKKFLFLCIAPIFAILLLTTTAHALEILYEHSVQHQASRGVVYEQTRMMTVNGMLDVHVLKVDLTAPYISVAPVASNREIGLKETTTNLLRDAGAIAGINADFFSLAGTHSVQFGPAVVDGQVLALNSHTNHTYNEFATFYLDANNNPFFSYMRATIRFYNNGVQNVFANTYNSIGNAIEWPTVVSRHAMYDTVALDGRFPGLTKIVVNDNVITQVSAPGQNVVVPENGYIVILPERMAYRSGYFNVGDTARLELGNTLYLDFSNMNSAIGGGGLILAGGQIVNDSGTVPTGRHPRTAVGATRDGNTLILMTIDGRNHSVGANRADMAALMLRSGAYNAMNLDGGGSSTMVTSTRGQNYIIVNTPSEGSQRRVVNALGVFDDSPIGAMSRLVLEPNAIRTVVGVPVSVQVYGEDEFWNRIAVNQTSVSFSANDGGTWANARYTPLRSGAHTLEAVYGGHRATQTLHVHYLAELQSNIRSLTLQVGERMPLSFTGVTTDGFSVAIPEITQLNVEPAHLGHFQNGEFVAAGIGAGFATAYVGGVRLSIPVTVGGFSHPINMFTGQVGQLSVPAETQVAVNVESVGSSQLIRLRYVFEPLSATQAAYVTFYPALAIPGSPTWLRMYVYGDGSGHWLRARVRDGAGYVHLIDFTRNASFTGWQSVTARMPNAAGPFTIDQIYMVTLDSYEYSQHTIFFYGLEALTPAQNNVELPQNSRFHDNLHGTFLGVAGAREIALTIPAEAAYEARGQDNFAIITMTAVGGSISDAERSQWGRFMGDVRRLNPEYVVILLDYNPQNFRQRMEFELFHLAMLELHDEGRTVFIVSATGEQQTLTMRDGIRYINLARPAYGQSAAIRFLTYGGQVRWQ